jgi:hypothetical protein
MTFILTNDVARAVKPAEQRVVSVFLEWSRRVEGKVETTLDSAGLAARAT